MLYIFLLNLQLLSRRVVQYFTLFIFGELPWLILDTTQTSADDQEEKVECLQSSQLIYQQKFTQAQLDFIQWKRCHPSLLQNFHAFERSAFNKRVVVFLDYDGTLTPIVNDPEKAVLSNSMRQTVSKISQLFPTAIISGRSLDKLKNFIQLNQLFYAGSHGMDIQGPSSPSLPPLTFQPASQYLQLINQINTNLKQLLDQIPGATVEHNKFCVSAHFRNCDPSRWQDVCNAVNQVVHDNQNLKITKGRKVLEIRPKINWDKGRALQYLLEALELTQFGDVHPIYIGDDTTDEDAFEELNRQRNGGFGILVSSKAKKTAARYTLNDTEEVLQFLGRMVEWGESGGNAWGRNQCCNGWKFNGNVPSQSLLLSP